MKKIYNILLSFVFAGCLLGSCDYLDIVPNETANEEDAFASEQAALNYLYSCYSFMPAYQNSHTFIGYAGDEIVSCFNGEPIKLYFQGGYTSGNIGNVDATYSNMYKGIRQCYLLKKNIASVPGLSDDKINDFANQADFLIALYNPSSKKRKDYLARACDILLEYKEESIICGIVRNIAREEESMNILTLKKLRNTEVDMFSTVYIGNKMTKIIKDKMVTPRGYRYDRK